ncbi:hypothetical protein [uncultured Brevundimonas sp.]|uniref:hypothetical protein n=1 Tax=uncultured Brevundimonas sp. TaxID=213418 RepID=UPI002637EE91|nr:hypothetical protein [uncultured Brevundimonas sp.]
MRIAALLVALPLTACAPTVITKTEYVEVKVPVPVPCTVNIGPAPEYADTAEAVQAAPDIFEAVKLLLAGREQRIAREAVTTAALSGCTPNP